LEVKKERVEFEEAISVKVIFYDKKIKELLESIERKDNMIENLKNNRMEADERIKFL